MLYTLAVSALALTFGVFYPAVRHRERGPDPDQLRRRRVHDGQPVPAGGGDHDRGAAGHRAAPRLAAGRPARSRRRQLILRAARAVVGICVAATLVPLRLSARRLELMEW